MFGPTAQSITEIMEFKQNNKFDATVFLVYVMTIFFIALTLFFSNSIIINNGDVTNYAYGLIGTLIFNLIATIASIMTYKVFFGILVAIDLADTLFITHYLFEISAQPAVVFFFKLHYYHFILPQLLS